MQLVKKPFSQFAKGLALEQDVLQRVRALSTGAFVGVHGIAQYASTVVVS